MRFLGVLLVMFLAACGGGGGGGGNGNTASGDLAVTFSGYQATVATAYTGVSFTPIVSDLNGNAPTYKVVSGSLPAGLSLDPSTGVVSGVPTGSGTATARIELTVRGFTGSLSVPFALTVNPVSLSYTGSAGASWPTPATTFQVGAPLPSFRVYMLDPAVVSNGSSGLGPLQPAPGVTIGYQVASGSALPAGLVLDASTGVISGSPTTVGTVDAQVQARVTAGGVTQTYSAMIPFSITAPSASLAYGPKDSNGDLCISSPSAPFANAPPGGTPITLTPVLSGGQPGDAVSNFSANSGNLGGLSLDPNTGVLSGTSFAPNNFCGVVTSQFDVSYTLTRGGYSSQLTTHVMLFQ